MLRGVGANYSFLVRSMYLRPRFVKDKLRAIHCPLRMVWRPHCLAILGRSRSVPPPTTHAQRFHEPDYRCRSAACPPSPRTFRTRASSPPGHRCHKGRMSSSVWYVPHPVLTDNVLVSFPDPDPRALGALRVFASAHAPYTSAGSSISRDF